MSLFVVQVLKLEMQAIDFLATFGRQLLCVSNSKNRIAALASETSQEAKDLFLLIGGGKGCFFRVGCRGRGIQQGQEFLALFEGFGAGVENGQ